MTLIPAHSRRVKVITEAEFRDIESLIGTLTYETTEFCVWLNAEEDSVLGVYIVQSEREEEPFIKITSLEEIAPDASKKLIKDPSLDVSNALEVLCRLEKEEIASEGPETIVFISKHDHITFAHLERPLILPEIQVVDVVPPSPSKLEVAFEVLQSSGMIPKGYPVNFSLIDEAKLVEEVAEGPILIPCRFDEIQDASSQRIYSVDKDLHQIAKEEVHIIGCQRTKEAAEVFGIQIRGFDNICPEQNLPDTGIFVAKCCLTRNEVEMKQHQDATGIIVPWGFNYSHIFQAGVALQEIILERVSSQE